MVYNQRKIYEHLRYLPSCPFQFNHTAAKLRFSCQNLSFFPIIPNSWIWIFALKKFFYFNKKMQLKLVGHKIKFCRSVINGKSSTSFPISKQKRKWSNLVDCMSLLIFWQLFIFKWIYKLDYQIVIINKTKEQSRKCYLALCKLVATRLLLLLSEKKRILKVFNFGHLPPFRETKILWMNILKMIS